MKAKPAQNALLLSCIGLLIFSVACSPKRVVIKGRVLDAVTEKPIEGAAVAIRWLETPSNQDPSNTYTFDSAQDLSDGEGTFKIPEYLDKKYVMGVYKKGYITWSSQTIFPNDRKENSIKRTRPRIANGMQIKLEPLKEGYSQDQHASFTILVAGEVSDSQKGPFYRAIESEFRLWREKLRREFRKIFGEKDPKEKK